MGKYKTGDKVRIVSYGHLGWIHEDELKHYKVIPNNIICKEGVICWYDMEPRKVGKEFIVANESESGGSYQLNNLDGSYGFAWADEKQLELIND